MNSAAITIMPPARQDIVFDRESRHARLPAFPLRTSASRSTFTTIGKRYAQCISQPWRRARISHNLGCGVDEEMDELLHEHRVDG